MPGPTEGKMARHGWQIPKPHTHAADPTAAGRQAQGGAGPPAVTVSSACGVAIPKNLLIRAHSRRKINPPARPPSSGEYTVRHRQTPLFIVFCLVTALCAARPTRADDPPRFPLQDGDTSVIAG